LKIDELRHQIDAIDLKLLELLNHRAEIARQIGQEKMKLNLPVFDSTREQVVLSNLTKNNPGPLADEAIQKIFRSIIQACTDLQK
jgi:chorismate mutase-like protein